MPTRGSRRRARTGRRSEAGGTCRRRRTRPRWRRRRRGHPAHSPWRGSVGGGASGAARRSTRASPAVREPRPRPAGTERGRRSARHRRSRRRRVWTVRRCGRGCRSGRSPPGVRWAGCRRRAPAPRHRCRSGARSRRRCRRGRHGRRGGWRCGRWRHGGRVRPLRGRTSRRGRSCSSSRAAPRRGG